MDELYFDAPLSRRRGSQEFRLVKLQHSQATERIKCTLQAYSFEKDWPAYVALSYAWGEKERYDDIDINGSLFPVGKNLWTFLHEMRLQHLYMSFWIDAICIDQSNVLEQNHQVQMMRRIYSTAHSVWIWLGEANAESHSDSAMEHLATRKQLGTSTDNYTKFWTKRQASGIRILCERNYWRRIWIVQEIMLAKRATILCGSKKISWQKFQTLFADLQTINDKGRARHILLVSEILDSPAAIVVKAKSKWTHDREPLISLLEQYYNQQATNVRDKVYALHGLANDSDDMTIDYRITPKDLLVEVVYHACSSRGPDTDRKHAKKEVLRVAKIAMDALKVYCPPEELEFHITVAKGWGVELEKETFETHNGEPAPSTSHVGLYDQGGLQQASHHPGFLNEPGLSRATLQETSSPSRNVTLQGTTFPSMNATLPPADNHLDDEFVTFQFSKQMEWRPTAVGSAETIPQTVDDGASSFNEEADGIIRPATDADSSSSTKTQYPVFDNLAAVSQKIVQDERRRQRELDTLKEQL